MKKYKVIPDLPVFHGKLRGSYSDKFNRVAKLAASKADLVGKFDRFFVNDSERSRAALACKLMCLTGIRIGNEHSTSYKSKREGVGNVSTFGLTTLLVEHLTIRGKKATLSFVGKRSVSQCITISDPSLVAQLKVLHANAKKAGRDRLFGLTEYQVRSFTWQYVGDRFTPKDFRTMYANEVAHSKCCELLTTPAPTSKRAANAEVRAILETTADALGNTASVCKVSYVDAHLLLAFSSLRK